MLHFGLGTVNANSPIPLYLQVRSILIAAIEKGILQPGRRLPNTSEISRQLRVSMLTAHRALNLLAQEGWLLRGQGHCTVVRPDFRSAVDRKPRYRIALALRRTSVANDPRMQRLLAGVVAATGELAPRIESVVCGYGSTAELDSVTADGVLCICPDGSELQGLQEVANERPVVVLGASDPSAKLHCVDSDDYSGARMAIRHLLELGHRRIAVVAGPCGGVAIRRRLDGFAAELAVAGLDVADSWTLDGWSAIRRETHRRRLLAHVAGRHLPTAVFAADLAAAVHTLAWLQQEGIEVPDAVSVIGYEDGWLAEHLLPGLTTVRQPLNDLAARAVTRLEQLLTSRSTSPASGVESLADSLAVRRTTGPLSSRTRSHTLVAIS